jgi:hypothetical protein
MSNETFVFSFQIAGDRVLAVSEMMDSVRPTRWLTALQHTSGSIVEAVVFHKGK